MNNPLNTTLPVLEPTMSPQETSVNTLSEGFSSLNISNSSDDKNSLSSQDMVIDINKDKYQDLGSCDP